ncbi:uncharacterized protein LOC128237953 [Mya arenaria]|uniref:uncharacterized protein LOC128237953 n=1 Tax=Mya arenaria TaxID=6604 RepID=UPI0022E53675|nr:uncharacterized protein LOC128237953 [Mya arenaria]
MEELHTKQPLLAEVLLAVTLPTSKIGHSSATNSLVPVIGAIYGMLMKQRFHELSLVQKVVTITLANEQTHQKVYDRLQPLGITLSHSGLLSTMDTISGHFKTELIDAIKERKQFRIVGDNINFQLGVAHARKSSGKIRHMEHWFGSTSIVQNMSFDYLSDQSPQCDLRILPVASFLLADDNWKYLIDDMNRPVARTLTEFFPWLKFAKKAANEDILGEHSQLLHEKNKVIPLPIMAKNEQKYSDVVDILDSYESLVNSVHISAGMPPEPVHIGGDQLTRERFSGAKRLRAAALTPTERFENLKPITFELFHLQMTVLSSFYQILYHTSNTEIFTLHAKKIRLQRKDADGLDVKNHYNDCKELAVSFIKSYIVEAACEYFQVEDTNAVPNIQLPDCTNMSSEDINKWLCELVRPLDERVLRDSRNALDKIQPVSAENHDYGCDSMHVYGKVVLEIGLVYLRLNDVIKIPDRNRLLRTLKYLMVFLKGHNHRSKYALEILQFLCQQLAKLSEKVANSSLYGLFVNTGGKTNTHIPADLQMEHLVRVTKNHLKSMCSNVSEASMKNRSSSFHGMNEISDKYDTETHVCRRAQKHKTPSSYQDELHLITDLRSVRPFHHVCGRCIQSLKNMPKNPITKLDMDELVLWIEKHKLHMYYDVGH